MTSGVYAITNVFNGKKYIGSSALKGIPKSEEHKRNSGAAIALSWAKRKQKQGEQNGE